jgi:hypothetical protein
LISSSCRAYNELYPQKREEKKFLKEEEKKIAENPVAGLLQNSPRQLIQIRATFRSPLFCVAFLPKKNITNWETFWRL